MPIQMNRAERNSRLLVAMHRINESRPELPYAQRLKLAAAQVDAAPPTVDDYRRATAEVLSEGMDEQSALAVMQRIEERLSGTSEPAEPTVEPKDEQPVVTGRRVPALRVKMTTRPAQQELPIAAAAEVNACAGRNITERAINLVRSRPGGASLSADDAHQAACKIVRALKGQP